MQAFFLVWLYFLMVNLKKTKILGYSLDYLFELNLVLQVLATPAYWIVIHDFMMKYLNLPCKYQTI